MKALKPALAALAALGLVIGVIYAGGGKNTTVEEAQTTVYDIMDKDTISVNFEKGSAMLSDSDRRQLRALMKSVRDDSKVERIIVAAWSDKPYPLRKGLKLSSQDQELADKRASAVEKVLEEIGPDNIDTYSMAEHPGWISKAFFTDEAQIKKSLQGKDVDDHSAEALTKTLKSKGGPSTAVVVIKRGTRY